MKNKSLTKSQVLKNFKISEEFFNSIENKEKNLGMYKCGNGSFRYKEGDIFNFLNAKEEAKENGKSRSKQGTKKEKTCNKEKEKLEKFVREYINKFGIRVDEEIVLIII